MPKPVYVSSKFNPVLKPNYEWDVQGASEETDPLSETNLAKLASANPLPKTKEEYKTLRRSQGRGVGGRRRTRKARKGKKSRRKGRKRRRRRTKKH